MSPLPQRLAGSTANLAAMDKKDASTHSRMRSSVSSREISDAQHQPQLPHGHLARSSQAEDLAQDLSKASLLNAHAKPPMMRRPSLIFRGSLPPQLLDEIGPGRGSFSGQPLSIIRRVSVEERPSGDGETESEYSSMTG